MHNEQWLKMVEEACAAQNEKGMESLLFNAGFAQPKKSATNLQLLCETLTDPPLMGAIAQSALCCADPDAALNCLERLVSTGDKAVLKDALGHSVARSRLLTILGASSFLTGILCRSGHFFRRLFVEDEIALSKNRQRMLEELQEQIGDASTFGELQKGLRLYKSQEILRIAARDLCGLASLQQVTAELTALAESTLQRAYEVCDALMRSEHGAPVLAEPDEHGSTEAQFTVLGMGKLGGCELNFSSDIDLIYFYSSERGQSEGVLDVLGRAKNKLHLHKYFVKLAEMITKAIGQVTSDGFVFRVDLRLRPEGNSGEMANSLRSAEVYYESWGQSWERSAMLKARPVAGSLEMGWRLLKALEPFVYRRYLDYGMVEDLKVMKQKIDRSLTREKEGERNLKLGRGGIREIEFFIQALQLIYAGKNEALREKNSLRALDRLYREGLIKEQEKKDLSEAYIFLRTVEHRIQVVQERQTHNLPVDGAELLALARRSGFADSSLFKKELERHRQAVEGIYRDLFYTSEEEIREEVRPEVSLMFDPAADPDLIKDILEEKGFKNPDGAYDSLVLLRDGTPHSYLTRKARRHFERIAPLLMQEVIDSPEPGMALLNLEHFIGAVRARATFFALLAENREIIKVLVSLFGTSQFLSRIFIQHPEILDSLVARSHAVGYKRIEEMSDDLSGMMTTANDYESKLETLRRFRNEEFLRIALNDIYGHTPQGEGTEQLSALAEVCLNWAVKIAREELMPRFGLPFCGSEGEAPHEAAFAIVGMGKLGGRELNYHSDLDIIFIYESDGKTREVDETDPKRFRQQSNQEYFSRLAQRVISVLTLMTREGYVYQIDTRLRPSGNQGPLVTSLSAFSQYHQSSAQLWERQALTKARVVSGPQEFAAQIESQIRQIVYDLPVSEDLKSEIYRLRGRMEAEIAREKESRFNIKTGRGGMVDVEFLVQYLQILHGRKHPALQVNNTLQALDVLESEALLEVADAETLKRGYRFLRRLENKLRLIHDQSMSELAGDRIYLVKLARRLGYPERPRRPDEVFLEDYRRMTEKIRSVFNRFLGEELESGN